MSKVENHTVQIGELESSIQGGSRGNGITISALWAYKYTGDMSAADVDIPRKVWTRADVEKIDPVLAESLELIEGELIDTMGKKSPHVYWKHVLRDWLGQQFGYGSVRTEDPIDVAPEDLSTNEPEPDITLTYQQISVTRGHNPKPEDIRLVIEISDTTYRFDRKVKARLYARARIMEYWVLDIRDEKEPRLLVHTEPQGDFYQNVTTYPQNATVEVLDGRRLCLEDFR